MSKYNHIHMSSVFVMLLLALTAGVFQYGSNTGATNVVSAFVTPQGKSQKIVTNKSRTTTATTTTTNSITNTALHERQWNFNEGQGPFGLKKNAETWNGRVAQMAFIFVVLQELIFGKGVVQGLTEGDPIYIACAVLFFASVGGLTLFLAIKGPDNYVDKGLGRK